MLRPIAGRNNALTTNKSLVNSSLVATRYANRRTVYQRLLFIGNICRCIRVSKLFAQLCIQVALILPVSAQWVRGETVNTADTSSIRETIAMLQFETVGASGVEVSAASDRLQEEVLNTGKFTLVDRSQIDSVLKEQAFQQTGCTTTECAVKAGRILGVRKLVAGKLTRLDAIHWLASAQLIDVETTETIRAVSAQYEGSFYDFLREGIPLLAARIAGVPPPQSPGMGRQLVELINPFLVLNRLTASAPGEPPPNAPKSGFAVFSGISHYSGTFQSISQGSFSFAGDGLPNAGIEYQWLGSPRWSVVVMYEIGSGTLTGDLTPYYDSMTGWDLGLEVRYWTGRAYVGGHISSWVLTFQDRTDRGNETLAVRGNGYGATAGYEWDFGWFVSGVLVFGSGATLDAVQVRKDAQSPRITLSGAAEANMLWINAGWRWK